MIDRGPVVVGMYCPQWKGIFQPGDSQSVICEAIDCDGSSHYPLIDRREWEKLDSESTKMGEDFAILEGHFETATKEIAALRPNDRKSLTADKVIRFAVATLEEAQAEITALRGELEEWKKESKHLQGVLDESIESSATLQATHNKLRAMIKKEVDGYLSGVSTKTGIALRVQALLRDGEVKDA